MALKCPRCATVVATEPGQKPVCPTCGYPGPDARAAPASGWSDGRLDAPTAAPGAGSGAPSPQSQPPPTPASPAVAKNTPALWALILGIAGFVLLPLALLTGIAAIVLGAIGLKKASDQGTGKGMAGTGLGLGIAQVVIAPIILAAVVFVLVQGLGDAMDDRADVTVVLEDVDGDAVAELVVYASVFEDGNTTTCDCRMTVVIEEGGTRRELFSGPVTQADFEVHPDAPGDGRAVRFVFDRDLPCDEETKVRLEVQDGAVTRTASERVC